MLSAMTFRRGARCLTGRSTLIAVLVSSLLLLSCADGGPAQDDDGGEDRGDYFTHSSLIEASQSIVVGRIVRVRDETFQFRSATTDEIVASLTERIMTVEITTVVKGSTKVGEHVAVLQTVSSARAGRGGEDRPEFDPLPLSIQGEYVFFLAPAALPPEFNGPEVSVWARTGEPGFAKVSGDALEFLGSERYRARAEASGHARLGSGDQFNLTLTELIAEVRE
jgi:hypothetical protein